KSYLSCTVQQITENAVLCKNSEGTVMTLACDFVVMATGARAVPFDAEPLKAAGIPVLCIGDCAEKPADISHAIRTAYDAANSL
ncbi:MAG: NADH oxidase, partial [Ruthenibacterium sp.]